MADGSSRNAYSWPNWLTLLLAVSVFVSPWIVGPVGMTLMTWNAGRSAR